MPTPPVYGPPRECEVEFEPHEDHTDCAWLLAEMNGGSYANFDDTDYSAWYGGEQGYRDGLRWSDFV